MTQEEWARIFLNPQYIPGPDPTPKPKKRRIKIDGDLVTLFTLVGIAVYAVTFFALLVGKDYCK